SRADAPAPAPGISRGESCEDEGVCAPWRGETKQERAAEKAAARSDNPCGDPGLESEAETEASAGSVDIDFFAQPRAGAQLVEVAADRAAGAEHFAGQLQGLAERNRRPAPHLPRPAMVGRVECLAGREVLGRQEQHLVPAACAD